MVKKQTGKGIKAKLLIAIMTIALVFTMMPLTMGNSYAEDEPVVTDEQVESDGGQAVDVEEPADVEAAIEGEVSTAEEADAVGAESEDLKAKEAEAAVLFKGNVLKQEKVITKADLEAMGESTVTFTGIKRKKNTEDSNEEITGVTIEKILYDYIGVKEGATIKSFKTVPELDYQPVFPAEWFLGEPVEIENATWGKAMLTFKSKKAPRLYLGAFNGMDKKESPSSDASPIHFPEGTLANNAYCVSELTTIEVIGTLPEPAVKDGQQAVVNDNAYTVTSAAAGTVALTKAKNTKKVTIPDTVTINGATLKVTKVNAIAFKGKKIRTVTLGKNIDTIAKYAFKKSKARTLIVKTKALTKKSVKGSLKKSKIKTVKVKVGTKKENKQYVKKYKKYFTKKNAGKKAKVRR